MGILPEIFNVGGVDEAGNTWDGWVDNPSEEDEPQEKSLPSANLLRPDSITGEDYAAKLESD